MKFEYQGQPVQLKPEVKKYLKSIGKKAPPAEEDQAERIKRSFDRNAGQSR